MVLALIKVSIVQQFEKWVKISSIHSVIREYNLESILLSILLPSYNEKFFYMEYKV